MDSEKRLTVVRPLTCWQQNIVLSEKPPITSTIQSLPPALLETLLTELSTLASVYHKPPEAFLGQGRFGAEAMQKAAIEYVQFPTVSRLLSDTDAHPTESNSSWHERTRSRQLRQLLPSAEGQCRRTTPRTC